MRRLRWFPDLRHPVIVVAVMVLAGGLTAWWASELRGRLAQLDRQAQDAQQHIKSLQQQVGRKPLIEPRYQEYASFWSDEPESRWQAALLDEVQALATGIIGDLSLKPKSLPRRGTANRVGVELELEAPQEAFLAFLDRLLTCPSPLELERLSMASATVPGAGLKAQITVSKLILPSEPAGERDAHGIIAD